MIKKLIIVLSLLASINAFAGLDDYIKKNEEEKSGGGGFKGPAIHFAAGIRQKKAPDLDMYHTALVGLKVTLFGVQFNDSMYMSFAGLGINWQPQGIFIASATPIIFGFGPGIGLGVDFFPVRANREGGPVGASINFDLIKIAGAVMQFAR